MDIQAIAALANLPLTTVLMVVVVVVSRQWYMDARAEIAYLKDRVAVLEAQITKLTGGAEGSTGGTKSP